MDLDEMKWDGMGMKWNEMVTYLRYALQNGLRHARNVSKTCRYSS